MLKQQIALRQILAVFVLIAIALTLIRLGRGSSLFETLVEMCVVITTTGLIVGYLVAGLRGISLVLVCLLVACLAFGYVWTPDAWVTKVNSEIQQVRYSAMVGGTLLLISTVCVVAGKIMGTPRVLIILSLVALISMLLPAWETWGTLKGYPPGSPDPNFYRTTYMLGRPLPWITWYESWNTARGTQNSGFRFKTLNCFAHILAIAVPLILVYRINRDKRSYGTCH